jgi:hypothetical protein
MRATSLAVGVTLVLSACATTERNYFPEKTALKEPEVGEQVTAGIGERILAQGIYSDVPTLVVNDRVSYGLGVIRIEPGWYSKVGENDRFVFYGPSLYRDPQPRTPKTFGSLAIEKDKPDRLCLIDSVGNLECRRPEATWETRTHRVFGDRGYQQTLAYAGRVRDRVSLTFDQRSDSQSAITETIEHDLGQGNLVEHRGARIEIVEATPESITCRVLAFPEAPG